MRCRPRSSWHFCMMPTPGHFRPHRPPDGGNSDGQVKNPDIDVDKPFTLTVPACTYYRKKCLKGQYKLYVAIMQSETMPPVMQEGDYWWGAVQEPLTLGDGTAKDNRHGYYPCALDKIDANVLILEREVGCDEHNIKDHQAEPVAGHVTRRDFL